MYGRLVYKYTKQAMFTASQDLRGFVKSMLVTRALHIKAIGACNSGLAILHHKTRISGIEAALSDIDIEIKKY